jgi:hypothetical protein
MKAWTGIVLLALVQGLSGCGDSGPSSIPSAASVVPPAGSAAPAQTNGTASGIRGIVMDTGFRRIAGATVEVVDGPHARLSTTTDAAGEFTLTGSFDPTTRFRAAKEGHVAATQSWNCSSASCGDGAARPWLGFHLAVLAPPVDVAGVYSLTFIADPACPDLPNEVRTRTYQAMITPDSKQGIPVNTGYTVTVSSATFVDGLDHFGIGVAGDHVAFWLFGGHNPALVEQVAPSTYVALSGTAAASVSASDVTISTLFDGWIEYYGAAVTRTRCESAAHRIVLTRR